MYNISNFLTKGGFETVMMMYEVYEGATAIVQRLDMTQTLNPTNKRHCSGLKEANEERKQRSCVEL